MIQPMPGRVLVEVIAVDHQEQMGPALKAIGLKTIDQKKHFDHKTLQGRVLAVGRGVYSVRPGEIVVFEGVDGFTTDQDAADLSNPILGEKWRWLKEKECLAVVEEIHEEAIA